MEQETKQTSWFSRHKILTGIGILFVIGAVANAIDPVEPSPNTGSSSETMVTTEESEKTEVIEVSASVLLDEYDSNAIAAGEKYEDKTLQITGIISDIGTDIRDEAYVKLADTVGAFNGVQCFFNRGNASTISTLNKGETITLQGLVSRELIGNVIVEDCQVVQ